MSHRQEFTNGSTDREGQGSRAEQEFLNINDSEPPALLPHFVSSREEALLQRRNATGVFSVQFATGF